MLTSEDTVLSHRGGIQSNTTNNNSVPKVVTSPPQQIGRPPSSSSSPSFASSGTSRLSYTDHGKVKVKSWYKSFAALFEDKKARRKAYVALGVMACITVVYGLVASKRHCDIILTGRIGFGTDLTGHYALQDGTYNEHPFYQSKHLHLYFSKKYSNWHISEALGSDSSLAYAVGVDHPNAYTADELDQWYIWDGERFRYDEDVESRCIMVSDGGYITLSPDSAYKKCLDISGGSSKNGANAHLWRCHGGHNQDWYWDSDLKTPSPITARNGFCLEAATLMENSNVEMWQCNSRDNQKWVYNYDTKEVRTTNDLCLHAAGASRDGTNVVIAQCTGSKRQKWTL